MAASTTPLITLITGANKGLGYAIAQALLQSPVKQGYSILLASRSLERAQTAVAELTSAKDTSNALTSGNCKIIPIQLDIDDDASIEAVRKKIFSDYGRLDILVNNAGIAIDAMQRSGELTQRQTFNQTFNTNVSSTSALTSACIELLLKSAFRTIVFVSSLVGSCELQKVMPADINDPVEESGWPKPTISTRSMTYRTSKAAENMMVLEWMRMLKPDNFKVHLICPGRLATELGGCNPDDVRASGGRESITAGVFTRRVIEGEYDEHMGRLINENGPIPW